jgi:hypothetical protein
MSSAKGVTQAMTVSELASPQYELIAQFTHRELAGFVIDYFFRRRSWLTHAHHAMSLATLGAIIAIAYVQHRSILRCLAEFALALVALFIVILPLHELLHAAAYRLAGARDVRWEYSARMAAVWVIAHHFVAETRAFLFVALAPFVVLNALLIALAIVFPQYAVFLLFVLLWHLHGSIGDWSLMNVVWLHRDRGFWTYDDAEAGRSFFYRLRPGFQASRLTGS